MWWIGLLAFPNPFCLASDVWCIPGAQFFLHPRHSTFGRTLPLVLVLHDVEPRC
jgi:hypothetical protein